MVELRGDQLPTAVDVTDHVSLRHADTAVVRRCGLETADGVDRRPREARVVGRHHEDGDAFVLGCLGIGTACEPHVVGGIGAGGEDFVAVDDPLVAVGDGAGLERGEVGAGFGLGVADREDDVAGQDARQEALLLLVGAVLHQCRADRVDGDERERETRALHLVEEHELFLDGTALPAVFFGPADTQPAVPTQQTDDLAEVLAAHTLLTGLAPLLLGQQAREIRAQFPSQLQLRRRLSQLHRCSPIHRHPRNSDAKEVSASGPVRSH